MSIGNSSKILIRISTTGIMAAMGIMCGLIPEVSVRSFPLTGITYAYARDYTEDEARNYARAGFEVELLRQKAYQEIKSSISGAPPNIVCNQPETLQDLDRQVRQIAERYCNESRQIVREHNLTIDRFNELKQYYDRGDDFYQQVQNILIDLQNQ
ncbi:DUF4168 domain-containing protein [Myxosarcina sp. GI1]|uniref:DUF4168 domain-containing protein n=1 Tax=Myxosarcina sp. GI1 TaxID=1541065 RepID=UPI000559F535|nr:DUF4168 domain-containing protein [Myxosarcina sp. GI1]